MFPDYSNIKLQPLKTEWMSRVNVEASMLRLDLLHPEISGNKWFKLKYNIQEALKQNKDTILTFGGNRSNHIAATAAAAPHFGLKSIGIIRGEEENNPTLSQAKANGMEFRYINRTAYRKKEDTSFLQTLQQQFPTAFIVPEGGNNLLGIKGAREILNLCNKNYFTHICCPVGTGSTLSGIISQTKQSQKILSFCALKKAETQRNNVQSYLNSLKDTETGEWTIFTDYSLGGFAKKPTLLTNFMTSFEKEHQIPLDFIYNAKMLWGIKDLVQKSYFPSESKLLIIHTGGIQGNKPSFTV